MGFVQFFSNSTSKANTVLTVRNQTLVADTLVAADMPTTGSKLIVENNAGAITQTIPANATVAFPLNQPITFIQTGAGQVTFASTATMNVPTGFSATPKTRGQYCTVTAIQLATDVWYFSGDLAFV